MVRLSFVTAGLLIACQDAAPPSEALVKADFLPTRNAEGGTIAVLAADGISLVDNGERSRLPGTSDAGTFAWDHDGEHLLITRNGRLERVLASSVEPASAPVVLMEGWLEIRMPEASRDGQHIVVAARVEVDGESQWSIVLHERESGRSRMLTSGYDPCFDRSGQFVLMERFPDRDLWRISIAGGEPQRLLATPADRYTVQADTGSARIGFSSRGGLVVRDLERGDEWRVSPEGAYDRFPSFAGDGIHLLFFRQWPPNHACKLGSSIVERNLDTGLETLVLGEGVQMAAYRP